MSLVVTDATCLIALDRVGHLGVLPTLFVVRAPEAVAEEFGRRPPWLLIERAPPPAPSVAPLLRTLDRGEAEAIVLAQSYPDARLLVDEARGRRVAEHLGLRVTGTGGVLVAAKVSGLIEAVRPVLDALREEHGFRLGDAPYDAILRLAGEA